MCCCIFMFVITLSANLVSYFQVDLNNTDFLFIIYSKMLLGLVIAQNSINYFLLKIVILANNGIFFYSGYTSISEIKVTCQHSFPQFKFENYIFNQKEKRNDQATLIKIATMTIFSSQLLHIPLFLFVQMLQPLNFF